MLPVANVAKNPPRVMYCIHIKTGNVFYNIKQPKKKKSNSECCKKYPFVIFSIHNNTPNVGRY
jgi:hypothetical protein